MRDTRLHLPQVSPRKQISRMQIVFQRIHKQGSNFRGLMEIGDTCSDNGGKRHGDK